MSVTKKIIILKPIDRKRWHGKKGIENTFCPKTVRALVGEKSHKYTIDISKERLKELEEETGYNLDLKYHLKKAHPFWDGPMGSVKLLNSNQTFNSSEGIDEIKIGILKADVLVANSQAELEKGKWPQATHVIVDKDADVKQAATIMQRTSSIIMKIGELSREDKNHIVHIMTGKSIEGLSDDFAVVEMGKLAEKKPELLLQELGKDKEFQSVKSVVLSALDKQVLRKDAMRIKYYESTLGVSIDEVVEYFLEEKNQNLYLRIVAELNK